MTASQQRQHRAIQGEDIAVFDGPAEQPFGALAELCIAIADDTSLHEELRGRADAARTEIDRARSAWSQMQSRQDELEEEVRRLATQLQRLRELMGAIARTFEDEEWPGGL